MDCLFYKTKDYIIEYNETKKTQSSAHIFELNNKQVCFIEATHKEDPTEFTDDVYAQISKICKTNAVYVDLSNLYGVECNSWLMKWIFVEDSRGQLIDEEFYVMKDLQNIEKDEFIILKEYINKKQRELTVYQ